MRRRLYAPGAAIGLLAAAITVPTTFNGVPKAEAASFQDWSTVAAGGGHVCSIRHGGKLYCWGGLQGGFGVNSYDDVTAPRRFGSFEDWSAIGAGRSYSCAIRHGGKLYCWGDDENGQVGDGDGGEHHVDPPTRIGSFADWSTVAPGVQHTCGIRHGAKLYCWGRDNWGQVGDGNDSYVDVTAPRRIGSFEDWSRVTAGGYHTCGIRHGGKLYCWGGDDHGQVGDDGGGVVAAPKRVSGFEDWTRVSAGYWHTCGIRHGGELYCWGDDGDGQIGDGNRAETTRVPRRIGTFQDWSAISTGDRHTCGIRHGGKLYCWGNDSQGEVGDGGADKNPIAPKRIGTFEDWAAISAGYHHTCGTRRNGKLYCWGADGGGELGDGERTDGATSPRRI